MKSAPTRLRNDRRSAEAQVWRGWYHTQRWRAIRRLQLQTEPLCRMCSEDGRTTAATVCDHVTPHKGDADLFWSGPFQSLCATHHNSTKQAEEAGKPRARVGIDGYPVNGGEV